MHEQPLNIRPMNNLKIVEENSSRKHVVYMQLSLYIIRE